jgi:hypothetical protein
VHLRSYDPAGRLGMKTLALLLVLVAELGYGQEISGWTRILDHNEDHDEFYVWTLADSGGRGAAIVFSCDDDRFRITTRENLLAMSDVKDGQVMVALLSAKKDRLVIESFLDRDQTSVRVVGEWDMKSWLGEEENAGEKVTVLLSNNGLRETYTFINQNGKLDGQDFLSCRKPKTPKTKK